MQELGKFRIIDNVRGIWPDEARDFTPWLAENMALLAEALGIDIELEEREAPVGKFSLDILAKEVGSNSKIVIENQLEATDHDHLGKIITYASGYNADYIIWISPDFRDEHSQAIQWLNERTDEKTDFFAVEVEVIQIDESKPAVLFRPIVVPNQWQKTAKDATKRTPLTDKGELYKLFFQPLMDELRQKHHFTNAKIAQPQNWYSFQAGCWGFKYSVAFANNKKVRVELYIDKEDLEENKRVFEELSLKKELIEKELGFKLDWERLDDRRACRIAVYREASISDSPEHLAEIKSWVIQMLLKFKDVFGNHLR